MPRTIKFRAWDKENKKMSKCFGILDAAYEGFPRPITNDNGEFDHHAEFELMQFTGLLDKKGKEIYEGDILLVKDKHKYPVVFKNGAFEVELNPETYWRVDKCTHNGEIIGNIYENPELKGDQ